MNVCKHAYTWGGDGCIGSGGVLRTCVGPDFYFFIFIRNRAQENEGGLRASAVPQAKEILEATGAVSWARHGPSIMAAPE